MQCSAMLLGELDELVRETTTCWEEGWVSFTWQNYTYDHVQRVRNLACTLGQREGVDLQVLETAALLHDVTKGYDGEIFTDEQGRRILDEEGFWHNKMRRPTRRNRVTDLYDQLKLAGQLHNESGATMAFQLLTEHEMPASFCEHVAQVIRSHLRPGEDTLPEGLALYDADTIDANCGLPAFLRNIQIHLHFREVRAGPEEVPLDTLLRDHPRDYLETYIRQGLPSWATGKRRDFLPRLTTQSGQDVAQGRLAQLEQSIQEFAEELEDFDFNRHHGQLAVILYFMNHRDNPELSEQLATVEKEWLNRNGATSGAVALVTAIRQQMGGLE